MNDVRPSEKAPRRNRGASASDPVAHLWSGVGRAPPKTLTRARMGPGHFVNECQAKSVELTGFEPVAPSLRKMCSNCADQGNGLRFPGLWSGCGASDVMHREMW